MSVVNMPVQRNDPFVNTPVGVGPVADSETNTGSHSQTEAEAFAQAQQRLRNRRTKRMETIVGKSHEMYLSCESEVYVLIHFHGQDRYFVYNSAPSEDWPPPYERVKNFYPRPEINTPQAPNRLLTRACDKLNLLFVRPENEDHLGLAPPIPTPDIPPVGGVPPIDDILKLEGAEYLEMPPHPPVLESIETDNPPSPVFVFDPVPSPSGSEVPSWLFHDYNDDVEDVEQQEQSPSPVRLEVQEHQQRSLPENRPSPRPEMTLATAQSPPPPCASVSAVFGTPEALGDAYTSQGLADRPWLSQLRPHHYTPVAGPQLGSPIVFNSAEGSLDGSESNVPLSRKVLPLDIFIPISSKRNRPDLEGYKEALVDLTPPPIDLRTPPLPPAPGPTTRLRKDVQPRPEHRTSFVTVPGSLNELSTHALGPNTPPLTDPQSQPPEIPAPVSAGPPLPRARGRRGHMGAPVVPAPTSAPLPCPHPAPSKRRREDLQKHAANANTQPCMNRRMKARIELSPPVPAGPVLSKRRQEAIARAQRRRTWITPTGRRIQNRTATGQFVSYT